MTLWTTSTHVLYTTIMKSRKKRSNNIDPIYYTLIGGIYNPRVSASRCAKWSVIEAI